MLVVSRKGKEKNMATLQKRKDSGGWELQYRDEHHRKQTISLSGRKYKERIVLQLKDAVEVLVDKRINNDPRQDPTVKAWVENAPPEIQRKLTRLGLYDLPLRRTGQEVWNTFLDKYEIKTESTRRTFRNAKEHFFMFFKANELIGTLTKDRMEEWKAFLLAKGYATATVAGTIRKTKTVFNWAKKQKWLTESPLTGFAEGSSRNPAKDRVVTMEEYQQLLEACPDQEWRVIIALARIGGLRPCEMMVLRWSDIGVGKDKNRFHVYSPKLNPHEHLRDREVPLFPLLLAELDTLRSIPDNEGQEYVINRYSNREVINVVHPFTKIAERAGIGRIARPFDNMRASRATEVHREYGAIAESVWLGHSKKIASECYLMVTDEDYDAAAGVQRK
jgi:integrase